MPARHGAAQHAVRHHAKDEHKLKDDSLKRFSSSKSSFANNSSSRRGQVRRSGFDERSETSESEARRGPDGLGLFSALELHEEFEDSRLEGSRSRSTPQVMTRKKSRMEQVDKGIKKKATVTTTSAGISKPTYTDAFPHHRKVTEIVESTWFMYTFFAIVAAFAVAMGAELEYDDEKYADLWFNFNVLFLVLFVAEGALKIYTYGHVYFTVTWFVLEFIAIVGGCINVAFHYQEVPLFFKSAINSSKLFRIVLLGKLFGLRDEFQVIVLGFTKSVISLWSVFFVVLVICYGCTLFCFAAIGKHDYSSIDAEEMDYDHEALFGSIPKTMMTLFGILVIDEWSAYVRPIYLVQPWAVMFFVVYSVVLTLGLLNVVVGMVVDKVNDVTADHSEDHKMMQQKVQRAQLEKVVELIFHEGDGHEIHEEEFIDHDDKGGLLMMLQCIDFPKGWNLKDLFIALDSPGHKVILKEQFVDAIMNLIHADPFQIDTQVLLSMHRTLRDMMELRKETRIVHERIRNPILANPLPELENSMSDVFNPKDHPDGIDFSFGNFDPKELTKEFEADRKNKRECVHLDELPRMSIVSTKINTTLSRVGTMVAPINKPEEIHEDAQPWYLRTLPKHMKCKKCVESSLFQHLTLLNVFIFSLVLGGELQYDDDNMKDVWLVVNVVFSIFFCFEVVLKIYVYGHFYFRVPWFVLEFLTSTSSLLVLFMQARGQAETYEKAFSMVKISRIVLLAKLFNAREEFQIIILGFTKSLVNMWAVLFVLLVINYGCTLFCFTVIGKHEYPDNPDHDMFWGSIGKTMITLFSLLIVDNWADYARPVFDQQPLLVFFFVLYTVMLTFGLLNVVTGMVIDTVNNESNNHEKKLRSIQQERQRDRLMQVCELVFDTADGHEISEDEFVSHGMDDALHEMLELVNLPQHFSLKDFFIILDAPCQKLLSKRIFVDTLISLMGSSSFQRDCDILLGMHTIRRGVIELRKEIRTINCRLQVPRALEAPSNGHRGSVLHQKIIGVTVETKPKPHHVESHPWDEVRTLLHKAAMDHCLQELEKAWVALDKEYKKLHESADDVYSDFVPSTTPHGKVAILQERWYINHKLYSAVSQESLFDLRQALDLAVTIGVDEKALALLFTFHDALSRHEQSIGYNTHDVSQALDHGDWIHALDLAIEMALESGVDKGLLVNMLAQLAEGSGSDASMHDSFGEPQYQKGSPMKNIEVNGIELHFNGENDDKGKSKSYLPKLITLVQTQALNHAASELGRASKALEKANKSVKSKLANKRAIGPGYLPFSREEELFFVRNQIHLAIERKSLAELRHSLIHGLGLGIDPSSIELETIYRDLLIKHNRSAGFSPVNVVNSLQRGEWWNAISDIIAMCFARGCDRYEILKTIGRVCSFKQHPLNLEASKKLQGVVYEKRV